jgi:hypothetical protein
MNDPNLGGATREEYGGRVEEQIEAIKKTFGPGHEERFAELERAAGVNIQGPKISEALRGWGK